MTKPDIEPSRLRRTDVLRLGIAGLRARPSRLALSALGIAIGIAAMIAVVGISTSSRAALDAELDRLGTNLLRVVPNERAGSDVRLPADAAARISRIDGTLGAASLGALDAGVYRSALVERADKRAITPYAADGDLVDLLGAQLSDGRWHDHASEGLGTVVLGSLAADRLGVDRAGLRVQVGDSTATVIGILRPVELAPDLDTGVFVDRTTAAAQFAWDGRPSIVFERSSDDRVDEVRERIPGTVAPIDRTSVMVSRPSDALAAREAADGAFTGLLVGLSGVALLVGGIGVANTMVIAVLERRREIGLRRALGATRRHVRAQFIVEALLLSLVGGVLGIVLGTGVVIGVALMNGWIVAIPGTAFATGLGATLGVGAIAGAYPAVRAARTPPTVALAS